MQSKAVDMLSNPAIYFFKLQKEFKIFKISLYRIESHNPNY